MSGGLPVAPGLDLPLDAVTETFAMLAKRGAGKSNAAVVMAEQMHAAGLPWVAVDPKGDWWGIRSSRDGKGAGLPVLVLGGLHGDVPLEPTAGGLVADLIAEQRLTCVVDVSLMSKTDMRRFLADFAERLYTANTDPLHVFAEEAHEYIPQRVDAGAARMVGAWEKLVKWGRTHGLGVTLITQRSASLNKDVLTQVETLIALRTTGPQDQAQIRAWVDEHDTGAAMLAQLRKLANGEAFVLSPQWLELDEPLRIRFAQRHTFDSGATPRAGEKRVTPRSFAEVDLAALKEAMAETIERAKADDPKALRARIRDLEQQLAAEHAKPTPVPIDPKVVELATQLPVILDSLRAALPLATDLTEHIRAAALAVVDVEYPGPPTEGKQGQPTTRSSAPRPHQASSSTGRAPVARPSTTEKPSPAAMRETRPASGPGEALTKAERLILTALAQHGPRSVTQVATLTAYSSKGGGFRNALSALRSAGRMVGTGTVEITQQGLDDLGDYDPLPTGTALLDWWKAHQRIGKAEALILDALAEAWPNAVTVEDIAAQTGYSAAGGGFRNALSRLRTLELASGRGELVIAEELTD